MPKVVILDGPDGAGKTTIANNLQEAGFRYLHNGLYPDDTGEQLLKRYTAQIVACIQSGDNYVIDRCYLSEYVYGNVKRDNDRLGLHGRTLLRRLCQMSGVTEIVCLPRWDTVRSNWLAKVADYTDNVIELQQIYLMYRGLRHFDGYRAHDFELHAGIAGIGNATLSSMTGSLDARVVLIGERVNHAKQAIADLPFHSLHGSSRYLFECLRLANIDESDLAFINAAPLDAELTPRNANRRQVTHYKNLLEPLSYISYTHAVALGRIAEEACKQQGIRHVVIPHPAYAMRFKGSARTTYSEFLKEAINVGRISGHLSRLADFNQTGNGARRPVRSTKQASDRGLTLPAGGKGHDGKRHRGPTA